MRITIRIALAAMLATAVTPDLAAQSYAQQVWTQLQRAYSTANANDYTLNNYIIGKLDDDRTDSWTFSLDPNVNYFIIGACDTDCSDLDILVKDANGTTLVRDNSADDIPLVRFNVRSGGRYTIDVHMYTCSANPCYFGFGLFAR